MGKDNQITYLFLSGRKNRLEGSQEHAKEFFYGFDYFKKNDKNTEIIEFSNNNNFLLKIISYILIKLSDLPFFLHKSISRNNYKKITHRFFEFMKHKLFLTIDKQKKPSLDQTKLGFLKEINYLSSVSTKTIRSIKTYIL